MTKFLVPGWRGQLVVDVYEHFSDGEATNAKAFEVYVELAKQRGHSVPKTRVGLEAGIRNMQQRLSSDSKEFQNKWRGTPGPDLLRQYEKGRWGLREAIFEDGKYCHKVASGRRLVTAVPVPEEPQKQLGMFFLDQNVAFDSREIYILRMIPPPNVVLPEDQTIIKIGFGNPNDRVKSCQTGNPYKLEVYHRARVANAATVENKLHTALEKHRLDGGTEWRSVSGRDFLKIGEIIAENRWG